jgi:UDP-N-acetylmuramoyl-tripeptide--D-alanyl-D-alanine ligase
MIRLHDVLAGSGGQLIGELDPNQLFNRVVHDSRAVQPGDLFVAVEGERFDGHAFVEAARESGAVAALVSGDWAAGLTALPLPLVVVEDSLAGFQQLAAYWRGLFNPRVIGITGSIGKTTTKEVVAAVAGADFSVLRSRGNYNNEIGLPLSVLEITPDTEVVVLEMGGAYAFGEITQLVGIAKPDIGVVTTVTYSHYSRMGSLEAIAQTKSELIAGLPEDGLAILNGDEPLVRAMADVASGRVLFYGLDEGNDLRAVDLESQGLGGTSFTLVRDGTRERVQVPLLGLHNVYAALIGFAVGFELGMAFPDIVRGFETPGIQVRLVLTAGINGSTIIDDHYNANPKSSLAALALLADLDASRKIAVLGDMLELGDYEREGHQLVGQRAATVVDALYTVGERARIIAEEAATVNPRLLGRHFDDKTTLASVLREELQPGDLVLVKGSRGVQMETVIAEIREAPADQVEG